VLQSVRISFWALLFAITISKAHRNEINRTSSTNIRIATPSQYTSGKLYPVAEVLLLTLNQNKKFSQLKG
jgi:hypothetical protein